MKQKLQRLKGGRLGSQLFLKTFMLLAFMLSSMSSAWAQTTVSEKNLFAKTPTDLGGDIYDLGSNGNVHYYAMGLKTNGEHQFREEGGKNFYKLLSNDKEKAHIKLLFAPGVIVPGDVISITCINWGRESSSAIGYMVDGSNAYENAAYIYGTPITVSHTVVQNDIINDGANQYIRIYRRNGDGGSAFNTITVTRPAGNFGYSVVAKRNNSILKTIASGISQTDVTVYYPRYILDGTTLYGVSANASQPLWGATLTSASPTKVLDYTETINNVVFYTEAEDISNFSTANANVNTHKSSSNGYTARTAGTYRKATDLPQGKYKIYARFINQRGDDQSAGFKVGDNVVFTLSAPHGTIQDNVSSEEFVVESTSALSAMAYGDASTGLDYFYVVKTGDYVPEVFTITWDVSKINNGGDAWYTLGDDNTQIRETRNNVAQGTKVVCHATDNGDYYSFNRWFDASNESYGWGNRNYTFTESLNSNITIGAEFFQNRIYVGNVQNNEGGSVKIQTWNSGQNKYNDDNINGRKEIWANRVQYVAVPNGDYNFVRWTDGNTDNPREFTNQPNGQTISYTAVFEPKVSYTVTFDAQGGKADATSKTGYSIDLPNAIWPAGERTFDGWYTSATGGDKVNSPYTPTGNTTLYAHYNPYNHINTGEVIGNTDNTSGWWSEFSPYYRMPKGTQMEFTFSNYSNMQENWFNWLFAVVNKENCRNGEGYSEHFVLRADRYGWGSEYTDQDFQLLMNGNPVDTNEEWATFRQDMNGAYVRVRCTFTGNRFFFYASMTKGSHVYTYNFASKQTSYEADEVYVFFAVDHSHIKNFKHVSTVNAYKIDGGVVEGNGDWKMTNIQGVELLKGMYVGEGTEILVHALPADGYVFKAIGVDEVNNPRHYVVPNRDSYFYVKFQEEPEPSTTTWNLYQNVDKVYYHETNEWVTGDGTYDTSNMPDGVWDGAYDSDRNPLAGKEGIEFNNKIHLRKANTGFFVDSNGGAFRIQVNKGDIVTVNLRSLASGTNIEIYDKDNLILSQREGNKDHNLVIVASESGWLEVRNVDGNNGLLINSLKKTNVRDFSFVDGESVPASAGTMGYVNDVIFGAGIPEDATVRWTSSDPSKATVNEVTGEVTIANNFTGSVQISATLVGNGTYPNVTKSYTLNLAQGASISFEKSEVEIGLDEHSVGSYWQKATATGITGDIKYSIVSTTAKSADITEDNNGDGSWKVSIVGPGYTTVQGAIGAVSATYVIHTAGAAFDEPVVVFDFAGNTYQQTLKNEHGLDEEGVVYSIDQVHGNIANHINTSSINSSTGVISGFQSQESNAGGAIVVKATINGENKYYTITVPYIEYSWNFYKEGLTKDEKHQTLQGAGYADMGLGTTCVEGQKMHFSLGDLVNKAYNPGSAVEMPTHLWVDKNIPYAEGEDFPKMYTNLTEQQVKDRDIEGSQTVEDYVSKLPSLAVQMKKMLTWQGGQNQWNVESDKHKYWNYTFKTLNHVNKHSWEPIEYANEELYSYRGVVNGNNVRIIQDTQGLIFNAAYNKFGINDNLSSTDLRTRELDRCLLLQNGASLTVPHVKAGYYVKLHWYRHSTNSGDKFSVTNAVDLDGMPINSGDIIRMTGSHYQGTDLGYKGYTIVRAQSDGDVTFTIRDNGWTEIYTVEVAKNYETELKVMIGDVAAYTGVGEDVYPGWGGPTHTSYASDKMIDMHTHVVNVVRDADNNESLSRSDIAAEDWFGRRGENHHWSTDLTKMPSNQFGANPIIYIASYPGRTYGWNGWNLDVEVKPVSEDAGKLSIGEVENLYTRLGNEMAYGVYAVTNFRGTGTAHVIVRTRSGAVNGASYTLDMQEAYFPVGEYHSQKYPYTWDFTKYNMEGKKVYEKDANGNVTKDERTSKYMSSSSVSSYGGWVADGNVRKLKTREVVDATIPLVDPSSNLRKYNKFLFADGSQFPVNRGLTGASEIRETDGLRINLNGGPNASGYNDCLVTFDANLEHGFNIGTGSTITIPKVNHGMYIYIRSAAKPTSVVADEVANGIQEFGKEEGNTIMSEDVSFLPNDNPAVVALHGNDIPNNVWVYRVKVVGANTSKTFDVTVTPSAPIEGIGVTKYYKNTVQFPGINEATLMTDARNENIDFHNTGFFTKHDLKAYVARSDAQMSDSGHGENGVIGLDEIVVLPSKENSGTDKRGLVLKKTASESGLTARPRLPLFVPACNIANDNLNNNHLVGVVDATNVELPSYIKDAKDQPNNIYILTNQHYDWDWENEEWLAQKVGDKVQTQNPDGWHVDTQASFYILRDGGQPRPNSAYLEVPKKKTSEVKNFYMIYGAEFDEEEATGIEAIDTEAEVAGLEGADVYTVTGIKVAKPTKKGVYVVNGKKVYVK